MIGGRKTDAGCVKAAEGDQESCLPYASHGLFAGIDKAAAADSAKASGDPG